MLLMEQKRFQVLKMVMLLLFLMVIEWREDGMFSQLINEWFDSIEMMMIKLMRMQMVQILNVYVKQLRTLENVVDGNDMELIKFLPWVVDNEQD